MMTGGKRLGELIRFLALSVVILLGLASIIATSGGGSDTTVTGESGGTGSVAVFLGDGPADEYEHIFVWIKQVSLIPSDGNRPPVVIFQSQDTDGLMIDLLEFRDEDFFFTVKDGVPAGRYEKIRLGVSKIESEGGVCDLELIKLPSGKIDLNPQGGFEVLPGETLAIRLDMDANKSINLHPAGSSGKCIFRPVVFVEIKPGKLPRVCPIKVTGSITQLLDGDNDGATDGFLLDLTGPRGTVTVRLDSDTRIFDKEGKPAAVNVLAAGEEVWVRGRLDTELRLQAQVVVLGQVLTVDGKAQGPVQSGDIFPFLPDPGEELVVPVNVQLFEGDTLVLRGCDTEVGWEEIQQNVPARVIGKLAQLFHAAVVFLRDVTISGTIVQMVSTTEGLHLTIDPSPSISGDEQDVFVPTDTPIVLEGDGDVPPALLCAGRKVRVTLDPSAPDLTATKVRVESDRLEGTVASVGASGFLTVNVEGQAGTSSVHVQGTATILKQLGDTTILITFDQIKPNDEIELFGLKPSSCNQAFEAFVVIVEDKD